MDGDIETTNVIICGCGPTGAMLSVQLGRANINNICLERESGITTDPRGIALDEDGIRALQSCGIYDSVFREIGQCMGVFQFIGGTKKDLSVTPFTNIDCTTSEGGTGHVGFLCHKQPALEDNLRRAQAKLSSCELRSNSTLTSISEDANWVYATYLDKEGKSRKLRAKFFVGTDGKTGFTRKKYLEAKGVRMEQASALHYEETWIAMNWKMTLPTPETHPDFPLWGLGYSPEQVFDLFFPANFRFICNPDRPAVAGRFGRPEERLWRFECVVHDGEDGNQLCQPEHLKNIVHPYITHPGSRYGLREEVQYPLDCVENLRARPFLFSARSCNKWAVERVILCGDSAHVFPPFGGQGIASGFRDACSLAWHLEVACRPESNNHTSLLEAWYTERKQQLERSIAATVQNGAYVTQRDPLRIFIRDTTLWLYQLVPSWRREMEKGPRAAGMTRYTYQNGMIFLPEFSGGALFPQVYCTKLTDSQTATPGSIQFTDDVIYDVQKKGLFQLVVIGNSVADTECYSSLKPVDQWSDGQVLASETTFIIQDPKATSDKTGQSSTDNAETPVTVRIATADEFAASPLCENRPEPKYYDPYRMRVEAKGKKFIVLRKDRFVFAACDTVDELEKALQQITPILRGGPQRDGSHL